LANAALGGGGPLKNVPFDYVLEQLAERWHVPPWVVEEAPVEWVLRTLEYRRLEGSVRSG
jgi:hypothetical protein